MRRCSGVSARSVRPLVRHSRPFSVFRLPLSPPRQLAPVVSYSLSVAAQPCRRLAGRSSAAAAHSRSHSHSHGGGHGHSHGAPVPSAHRIYPVTTPPPSAAASVAAPPSPLSPPLGGHGHSHGSASRVPAHASPELRRAANAVVQVGMLTDLSLAVAKGVAGVWSGSSALISDAVHSTADILISGVALLSMAVSRAPPDRSHPYGHGKFDSLGALAVSGLLVSAGAGIGWHGVEQAAAVLNGGVLQPLFDIGVGGEAAALVHSGGGSSSGSLADPLVAGVAVAVSLGAVAVKEVVYRWNMRVGMAQRSQALIANAWHHRADSLSSLVAAVGVGGAWAGVPVLDPLASLGIALMIVRAGLESGWDSVRELADERLDDALLAETEEIALGVPHVLSIRRLRARRQGPAVLLDCEVGVTPSLSVSEAHDSVNALRARIFAARPEVSEVVCSTYPHCPAVSEWHPATAHDDEMGGARSGSNIITSSGGSSSGVAGNGAVTASAEPASSSGRATSTTAAAAASVPLGSSILLAPVNTASIAEAYRKLLLATPGVRAVTKISVKPAAAAGASDVSAAAAAAAPGGGGGRGSVAAPTVVDVEASLLTDLDLPLREALATLRLARRRVIQQAEGGSNGSSGASAAAGAVPLEGQQAVMVRSCELKFEKNPV